MRTNDKVIKEHLKNLLNVLFTLQMSMEMTQFFKIVAFYRLLYTDRVTNPLQPFSFVSINNLK